MKRIAKKVLLIGWDAADWKFLSPLMDAGLMPNLKKLVDGGVKGRLATLDPPLSPTLWTSIATGKRPYKHGIHGFTEPNPNGEGIRPIFHTNRKVKAIWNILTQHQLKTHVVGWWPSHPAEPINGVMVSNFYQRAPNPNSQDWPMSNGTVHPAAQADTFAKLRIHPAELTMAHLLPFVPKGDKIDQRIDPRLQLLAQVTADCSTIQSAATYILDNYEWDFTAVYFDAIDHYCHGFMKYHPPKQEHVDLEDFDLYKDVVAGGCRFHDMMLGRLMQMAGDDTTIILISDHGFHPDHNRPKYIPKEPSGPAVEHSPFGIIVMNGPGIKKDELLFGASLLDITPTLLTMFGLPVGEDMDGKVLVEAFDSPVEIETIKSWENIKGNDGTLSEEVSEEDMKKELQQLIDLGYIEDPSDDIENAVKSAKDENDFYLARSYFDGSKWEEGIQLLERLFTENPEVLRYATRLVHGYMVTGRLLDARKVFNHIKTLRQSESPELDLLEGSLLFSESRFHKALKVFKKVEEESGGNADLYLQIANVYSNLNKRSESKVLIQKALAINPEHIHGWYSLGVAHYKLMEYEEALDAFMTTVGLLYHFPQAHFNIGECLMKLEQYEDAVGAFEICLKISPNMNMARQRLISIYELFLKQPGKAIKYKTDFENNIKGEITIVSGLPRSGTSMMMQILEAGGMSVFTDKVRKPNENNPKGFYEHEAVKSIKKDKRFLEQAVGKVVKIIAQSLKFLPPMYRYKIVFMERQIKEVVASQEKMLIRNGMSLTEAKAASEQLIDQYQKTIADIKEWTKEAPNIDIHFVDYAAVIEEPFMQSMLINDFFDGELFVEKMAAEVDVKLYREKIK